MGHRKSREDNGLLILVALTERQVRIEVGYGLEGVITDLEAGRIIDEIIVPNFKNGDYSRGIYDAVVTISNQIYGEEDLALDDRTEDHIFWSWTISFPVFLPGAGAVFRYSSFLP